ncbi:MAG: Holliday junction resolvase RuvX [Parachlamydiaceae bacterium]
MNATRIVGIDYGMARIGLAVSDTTKLIATPMATFKVERKSDQTVTKLVSTLQEHERAYGYSIEMIVVGFPLLMSGKKGLLADEVTHFVELLKAVIAVPIVTWDERLTSVQADRSLREGNLSRKKRSQKVDSVAAVIILQNYLDFIRMEKI